MQGKSYGWHPLNKLALEKRIKDQPLTADIGSGMRLKPFRSSDFEFRILILPKSGVKTINRESEQNNY